MCLEAQSRSRCLPQGVYQEAAKAYGTAGDWLRRDVCLAYEEMRCARRLQEKGRTGARGGVARSDADVKAEEERVEQEVRAHAKKAAELLQSTLVSCATAAGRSAVSSDEWRRWTGQLCSALSSSGQGVSAALVMRQMEGKGRKVRC